jgi:transposase
MKSQEEAMQILEAYDLTGSLRAAAALAGVSHHTVARYVSLRDLGRGPQRAVRRERLTDAYLAKIEEWTERSKGKVRADVAHRRLVALGYDGSERTTRRTVAEAKRAWRAGHRRIYRPWIPEPGMWFQWDWGAGPTVREKDTLLFCAWLAWSRYRVVLPTLDRSFETLVACLDATLRRFSGAPTYGLTDNEKTVTTCHVAGIAVRNPELVEVSRFYGVTFASCVVADPESKGGSEATVRVAKADLVPTEANLLPDHASFTALERACSQFCREVNERPHRETRRAPVEMLAEERAHLHPVPEIPFTAAFGETRTVSFTSTISFGGVRYSVPHRLAGERVWVRRHGGEVVIVHVDRQAGPVEVARHALSTPGRPQILDEHYPPRPPGPLARVPKARSAEEAAFLSIGQGANAWLVEAAAAGTSRIRSKMAEAVSLAKLHGQEALDRALSQASAAGRFADGDLAAILAHGGDGAQLTYPGESNTLQPGTAAWGRLR